MTSTELNLLSPLDSPLPPPPEGNVLTAAQWRTFFAIADTVIPSIAVSTHPSHETLSLEPSEYAKALEKIKKNVSNEAAARYLQENASSTPGFKESVHRQLGHYMREDATKGIVSSPDLVSMHQCFALRLFKARMACFGRSSGRVDVYNF